MSNTVNTAEHSWNITKLKVKHLTWKTALRYGSNNYFISKCFLVQIAFLKTISVATAIVALHTAIEET